IIGTNLSTSPMESVSVLASDASVAPLTQKSNQAPSNHTLGNTDASGKTPILASPNPFSSTSLISFTLPHDGAYTLNLQDSRGSKIAQLAQGWGKAGLTYTARVDGSRLSSGLYVVSLQNGGITKTLKVMVSK
ncbi:MAG TPA: T9SS type A sorting domain-containing protein, partial [Flavisolibacter sp.]|nr:T9SS type A sorting domain-containing protein [Flavisolibacter sp.]